MAKYTQTLSLSQRDKGTQIKQKILDITLPGEQEKQDWMTRKCTSDSVMVTEDSSLTVDICFRSMILGKIEQGRY